MTLFRFFTRRNLLHGLSYIETVIGVGIFAFVALMLYTTYERVFVVARTAQARVNAVALANEQLEIVRNLPYSDVGTIGGIPAGVIPPVQTLVRGGMTFIATTTVRNIDLPFDGTIAGTPNDLSPADNKLVEIDLMCTTCKLFRPLVMRTNMGPKNLEGTSTNGSLFVQALDAAGLPVAAADVNIFNNSSTTLININDVTSTSGMLQIIDAPPGNQVYQIMVSKSGYSTERTYSPLGPTTTNPVKPHATVAVQTVTQLSFAIDRVATLNFSSVTPSCVVVPSVNFQLTGSKLIGTAPNVLKYNKLFATDASGLKVLNDIEWDSYTLVASSTTYDLAGLVPLSPLTIAPGANQNVQLIMKPKNRPSALITVKDGATGLPISGATVEIEKGGITTTQTTGRGFLSQTDWSGGSGQSTFTDATRYASNDGNVDTSVLPGEARLLSILGTYNPTGQLTSSTFDTGSVSNFYQLTYQPTNQPAPTGVNSVRFQLATGNSTSSWTYRGPDGTAGTYYTSTSTDIASIHNGDRYLRYNMLLSTASSTLTPSVSDVQFSFTSSCVPPGQVLFEALGTGTYNLTVSKSGYSTSTDTFTVSAGQWQEKIVTMTP